MLYSGNRKLGIVVGTPDMNPIYSGSAAIDSGINTFLAASIRNTSNISEQFNIFSKKVETPFVGITSGRYPFLTSNPVNFQQYLTGFNIGIRSAGGGAVLPSTGLINPNLTSGLWYQFVSNSGTYVWLGPVSGYEKIDYINNFAITGSKLGAQIKTWNDRINFYSINPNSGNVVECTNQPIILRMSGNWGGYSVEWETSKDKINWSGFRTGALGSNSTGNVVFTYSGNLPSGNKYLRLRDPAGVLGGGNLSVSLTYYTPDTLQFESEWPKPCEYFNGTILASEFPVELQGINEIGISIPYVIESGVSGYNIIQNILNTPTGSSLTINSFYDGFDSNKNYKFEIEEKSISGDLTYVAGNLILLNPDLPTFFNLSPEPVGGFFLKYSGQNHDLFFISNTDGVIYRINSLTTNQSTTYRVNNSMYMCGGNI